MASFIMGSGLWMCRYVGVSWSTVNEIREETVRRGNAAEEGMEVNRDLRAIQVEKQLPGRKGKGRPGVGKERNEKLRIFEKVTVNLTLC